MAKTYLLSTNRLVVVAYSSESLPTQQVEPKQQK